MSYTARVCSAIQVSWEAVQPAKQGQAQLVPMLIKGACWVVGRLAVSRWERYVTHSALMISSHSVFSKRLGNKTLLLSCIRQQELEVRGKDQEEVQSLRDRGLCPLREQMRLSEMLHCHLALSWPLGPHRRYLVMMMEMVRDRSVGA
jgi:hypothetical protein